PIVGRISRAPNPALDDVLDPTEHLRRRRDVSRFVNLVRHQRPAIVTSNGASAPPALVRGDDLPNDLRYPPDVSLGKAYTDADAFGFAAQVGVEIRTAQDDPLFRAAAQNLLRRLDPRPTRHP